MEHPSQQAQATGGDAFGWVRRYFLRWTMAGATVALTILPILTAADVVGRYFLNRPVPGATELTEILMVVIIFLALPSVSWRQEHITVDVLDAWTSERARGVENIVAGLVGAVMMTLAAWRLWAVAGRTARIGEHSAYLEIPMAPFIYFMTVLCAVMAIAFLLGSVRTAFDLSRKTR